MDRHAPKLGLLIASLILLVFPPGALSQSAPPTADPTLAALLKAEREGRLGDAEKLLTSAIHDAEQNSRQSPRLSLLLNRLAALRFGQGRYSDAIAAAKRALALDEELFGAESPRVVADLSNLGIFNNAAGSDAAAQQAFEQGLVIARENPGPQASALLMVLHNLSSFYATHHRPAEAEALAEEGLEVCGKVQRGPIATSCASFRRMLASGLRTEGDAAAAEGIVSDAVAAAPDSGRQWHEKVLDLETLALHYEQDNSFDLAEATYRQAIALIEKNTKPDDPAFLVQELNHLGEVVAKEGRSSEAEDLFKRALDLQEQAAGPHRPDLAESLTFDHLQNLYRTEGRLSDVEPLLQQGLALQERVLGPGHVALARTLLELAAVYEEEQKFQDAEPLYTRSLEIQQATLGLEDPRLISTLDRYAALLRRLDQAEKAQAINARADALRRKLAGQESP